MTIHTDITPATAAAPPAGLAAQHFKTALGLLETTHADAAQGWTPQRQSQFLAAIADGATVADAAAEVGLSRRSAYALRRTARGAAFRLGWQAAEILAADSLREDLWDRAKHGQTWTVVRDDGDKVITTTRHRLDNRLALAMLTRLENRLVTGGTASRLANRFGDFLSVLEAGDAPADAGELVATVKLMGTCESCEPDEDDDDANEAEAAGPPVWFEPDDEGGCWLTRFPAPPGDEHLEFETYGDPDYARMLTAAEEAAVAHLDPMDYVRPAAVDDADDDRTAALHRCDAWFAAARGLPGKGVSRAACPAPAGSA